MHMHEEKIGYFRYIKPVRRQSSEWGGDEGIHACMSLLLNPKQAVHYSHGSHGTRRTGTHKRGALWEASLSSPLALKLAS